MSDFWVSVMGKFFSRPPSAIYKYQQTNAEGYAILQYAHKGGRQEPHTDLYCNGSAQGTEVLLQVPYSSLSRVVRN